MAMEDPSLIGTTQDVWVLANDDIDMFMKGRSTDVDTERGSGIASPTGTTGEIQVLSTVNDFAMILDDVKDFLESEARKAERDLRRLEGNLEEIDQELVRGREALAAVPAGDEAQRAGFASSRIAAAPLPPTWSASGCRPRSCEPGPTPPGRRSASPPTCRATWSGSTAAS
jgi:phosphate transport system permease protein